MNSLTPTQELNNLLSSRDLIKTFYEDTQALQFRKNVVSFLADGRASHLSPLGRYTLAYEGIHALAVGVVYLYSMAPGKELGHRIMVLQLVCNLLSASSDDFDQISHASSVRNEKLYRLPAPPIGNQESFDLLNAGDRLLVAAKSRYPDWFALK